MGINLLMAYGLKISFIYIISIQYHKQPLSLSLLITCMSCLPQSFVNEHSLNLCSKELYSNY